MPENTTSAKASKYTPEMVKTITDMYIASGKDNDILPQIAEKVNKTVASVRSKLVREKIYVPTPAGTPRTPKDMGPTKKALLDQFASTAGLDREFVHKNVGGATKDGIYALIALAGGESIEDTESDTGDANEADAEDSEGDSQSA